jgi:hypothetical protein
MNVFFKLLAVLRPSKNAESNKSKGSSDEGFLILEIIDEIEMRNENTNTGPSK